MIEFKKVKMTNFLSVGKEPVEIELNNHAITLVTGENGAAKSSTCIDSIYYALYGKSFRKVNLKNMINSTNKKGMLVELEFSNSGNDYKIVRGQKPSVFEIYVNGILEPQLASVVQYQAWLTQNVLKMDERTFRQLIVIGSTSYTPFMMLSAPDRRVVIEDLLRIDVFSAMKDVAKQYVSENNANLTATSQEIDTLKVKISMQKQNDENLIKQLEESLANEWENYHAERKTLFEQEAIYKKLQNDFSAEELKRLNDGMTAASENFQKIQMLHSKKQGQGTILTQQANFFLKNEVCPTCGQHLSQEFIAERMKELDEKRAKFDAELKLFEEKIEELKEVYKNQKEAFNRGRELWDKCSAAKGDCEYTERTMRNIKSRIAGLEERIENLKNRESVDVQAFVKELEQVQTIEEKQKDRQKALQIITSMLKDDGVKSLIIKNYLPIINSLIAKYLNIIGYDIGFELDENFNESIRAHGKEDFNYFSFSEGERLRIDTAIMFAFRELAKIQSSISANILIMDEYDKGTLDENGFHNVVEILKTCRDENIIVISHSADFYSTIADRHLTAYKKRGFSHMRES